MRNPFQSLSWAFYGLVCVAVAGSARASAEAPGVDASVTARTGDVEARSREAADWSPATLGLELGSGARLATRAGASADLTLRDTSEIHLREDTVVVITHGAQRTLGRRRSQATLEKGAIRTHLGDLRAQPTLAVRTPSAETEVGIGNALVSVDDAGTTRVAIQGGKGATVTMIGKRGARGRRITVAPGSGIKVDAAGKTKGARPLLAAPTWTETAPRRVIALDGSARLGLAWGAVAGAATWRVEIAGAPGGVDVRRVLELPAEVTELSGLPLPTGAYWVTVASLDADGLEGRPSPPIEVTVIGVTIERSYGAAPPADPRAAEGPIAVPMGSWVITPAGTKCQVEDAAETPAPAAPGATAVPDDEGELLIAHRGRVHVTCAVAPVTTEASGADATRADAGGTTRPTTQPVATASFDLEVSVPRVGTASAADLPTLPRGRSVKLFFTVEPEEATSAIRLLGSSGLALGEVVETSPGLLWLTVTARRTAADHETVSIVIGDARAVVTTLALSVEK